MKKNKVLVMNTDLRDGRQAPGYSMRKKKKPSSTERILKHYRALRNVEYDVLEAGFPIGGDEEIKVVQDIAFEVKSELILRDFAKDERIVSQKKEYRGEAPTIAAMSFMLNLKKPDDYKQSLVTAFDSVDQLIEMNKARITMLVSTAPKLREFSTGMSKEEIMENAAASTEFVIQEYLRRGGIPNLQYYIEGASQTEPEFLIGINRILIDSFFKILKQEHINPKEATLVASLPDTTGLALPWQYGKMFNDIQKEIPQINDFGVVLSAHCHNDRGNAVANTISAVANGARQVEVTTLGIGERTGNADASQVINQLTDCAEELGNVVHDLNIGALHDSALSICSITPHVINPNHPIHGCNSNSTGAGIHQNAVCKDPKTYNIIDVSEYGNDVDKIVLTAMSGKNTVITSLKDKGFSDLPANLIKELVKKLKNTEAGKLSINDFIRKYLGDPITTKVLEKIDSESGKLYLDENSFAYSSKAVINGEIKNKQIVSFSLAHNEGGFDYSWLTDFSKTENTAKSSEITGTSEKGLVDAMNNAFSSLTSQEIQLLKYDEYIPKEGSVSSDAEVVVDITIILDNEKIRGLGVSSDQNRAAIKAFINALNRSRLFKRNSEMPRKNES